MEPTGSGAPPPSAKARRLRAISAGFEPERARRSAKWVRPTARVQATSGRCREGCACRWSARRAAISRRASGVRAETSSRCSVPWSSEVPGSSSGGGWVRTTWTLVPLFPKALTPATRPPSDSGQGSWRVATRRGSDSHSTWGVGRAQWRLAGIRPWQTARAALIRPATPEAAMVWPKLLFTEPTQAGVPGLRPWASTAPRARASRASARGSPSPKASTIPT